MIAEILEGLITAGTENFATVLGKLLNELMKIERENCIGAQPFEKTEERKEYRSEKALKLAIAEMYVQGFSTGAVLHYLYA